MTVAVGTRLGAYEILMLLGEGGMGQGYRARDRRSGALSRSRSCPTRSSRTMSVLPDSSARRRRLRPITIRSRLAFNRSKVDECRSILRAAHTKPTSGRTRSHWHASS
jgi:serine/threonine protein kinase